MTPLIPIKEAARLLGVSQSLLYSLCSDGKVPHVKINSRLLFRPESLEAWVEEQETVGAAKQR